MLRSNTFLEEKNDHLPREGLLWGNVAGPASLVGGSSLEVQASSSGSPLKMSFKKKTQYETEAKQRSVERLTFSLL